jgi:hypothetical protein
MHFSEKVTAAWDYWGFGLLPLSSVLKNSKSQNHIQFQKHYSLKFWTMDKYENPAILSVTHHHQNSSKFTILKVLIKKCWEVKVIKGYLFCIAPLSLLF